MSFTSAIVCCPRKCHGCLAIVLEAPLHSVPPKVSLPLKVAKEVHVILFNLQHGSEPALWLYEVPRTVESQMRGAAQSSVCAAVLPRSAPVSMWQAAEVVVRQLKSRPPLRRASCRALLEKSSSSTLSTAVAGPSTDNAE